MPEISPSKNSNGEYLQQMADKWKQNDLCNKNWLA
jgi:hypothetical protein